MRIWVDCTAAAHPLVLRPIIERLARAATRSRSPRATTARRSASSTGSASRYEVVGRHGGGSTAARGWRSPAAAPRSRAGRGRRGSTSRSPTARSTSRSSAPLLRIPLGADAGLRVRRACSASSPSAPRGGCWCRTRSRSRRCARAGAAERKLFRYPGLKEDYYLADFAPDPAVLGELGVDRGRACSPSSARRPRPRPTTRATRSTRRCSTGSPPTRGRRGRDPAHRGPGEPPCGPARDRR